MCCDLYYTVTPLYVVVYTCVVEAVRDVPGENKTAASFAEGDGREVCVSPFCQVIS